MVVGLTVIGVVGACIGGLVGALNGFLWGLLGVFVGSWSFLAGAVIIRYCSTEADEGLSAGPKTLGSHAAKVARSV